MSDDEKGKEEERDTSKDKKVDVEAKATVSDDEGKATHEVDVKATADVRDLSEKREEKEAAEEGEDIATIRVSQKEGGGTRVTIDVDDPAAHKEASVAADRPTAKAAVAATSRSFGSSGRPD